ncbi:SMI1/KNR4 family protein [Kitasatospora phosalacinea]|uniref:SMI1/KNR4 family protein n=1 Tax=Kitasatospora phosalacinea TaxID=2065 RepID=UPI003650F04F
MGNDAGGPGGRAVDWAGVRERVTALRKAPRAGEVFGARGYGSGHDFRLRAPLTGTEVAAAEAELGVRFPADYRGFLLRVGAGGAGPSYGVFPLCRDEQGWHWLDGEARSDHAFLTEPFPSAEQQARWTAEVDAREPVAADFPDEASHLAAYRAWNAEYERIDDLRTAGAVRLSDQGCGYYDWLVVTGPERGTVWADLRAGDGGLEPLTLPGGGARTSFGEWYLHWLATATREAREARGR